MTGPVAVFNGDKTGTAKAVASQRVEQDGPVVPIYRLTRAYAYARTRGRVFARACALGGKFNGDNGDTGDKGAGSMGEAALKPCIRELVGRAVNTSAMKLRQVEGPVDRIAAMGAAGLAIRLGADHSDVPIATAYAGIKLNGTDPDARDVIAGELIPVLWHVRYGGQFDQVPTAIRLFSEWIVHRKLFADCATDAHLALRAAFATRLMHEWLSDRCAACKGSGKQQRSRTGQWICPQGSMQRNATFRACTACNGSRRAPSSPPQRMKALGLTREQYDEQRWDHRFSASFAWLNQLLPNRLTRPLTAELERRKRRTQSS